MQIDIPALTAVTFTEHCHCNDGMSWGWGENEVECKACDGYGVVLTDAGEALMEFLDSVGINYNRNGWRGRKPHHLKG